jgi:hypothetical protein
MICPICGNRVFIEKKWDSKMKVINFETREISIQKQTSRQKSYYCSVSDCGYRLYGSDDTKLRKEMKYLNEVE